MGTIEERAREYANQYRRDVHDLKGERADAAFAAYCQGQTGWGYRTHRLR